MSDERKRLFDKGAHAPTYPLLTLARVSLERIDEYRPQLLANGLTEEHITRLREAIDQVESLQSVQSTTRAEKGMATKRAQRATKEAKAFVRRLRLAVPLAMEGVEGLPFLSEAFNTGRLGRSTPRVALYLDRIRGLVVTLDARLSPYFKGESALKLLDERRAALLRIDSVQEVAVSAAPSDTFRLYEAKGRLLGLIERLHCIARIAFDDAPLVAARFNKELLRRARRSRRKAADSPVTPSVGQACEAEVEGPVQPEAKAAGASPASPSPQGSAPPVTSNEVEKPERSLPRNEGDGVEGPLDFGLASSAHARGNRRRAALDLRDSCSTSAGSEPVVNGLRSKDPSAPPQIESELPAVVAVLPALLDPVAAAEDALAAFESAGIRGSGNEEPAPSAAVTAALRASGPPPDGPSPSASGSARRGGRARRTKRRGRQPER